MLFSVVVPVYNVEKYLQECIDSIYQQMKLRDDIELILINDGSTDNSGHICDMNHKIDPKKIRVFHKKNEGLLLTRRFGFTKAKGKYIVNCDSDDYLNSNYFSLLTDIILKYDPDVILFNAESILNGKSKPFYNNIFSYKEIEIVEKNRVIQEFFRSNSVVSMCMKCFKRTCLDELIDYTSYSEINNGEDTLQSIEIYSHSNKFVYLNKTLYYYRIGSGMTVKYDETYYSSFKFINQVIEESTLFQEFNKYSHLLSVKYFTCLGRAITQSRFKRMSFTERKKYLKDIHNDCYFNYKKTDFQKIKKQLRKSHQLFCFLFINKQYLIIHVLLNLKNLIGRRT